MSARPRSPASGGSAVQRQTPRARTPPSPLAKPHPAPDLESQDTPRPKPSGACPLTARLGSPLGVGSGQPETLLPGWTLLSWRCGAGPGGGGLRCSPALHPGLHAASGPLSSLTGVGPASGASCDHRGDGKAWICRARPHLAARRWGRLGAAWGVVERVRASSWHSAVQRMLRTHHVADRGPGWASQVWSSVAWCSDTAAACLSSLSLSLSLFPHIVSTLPCVES